MTEAQIKAQEAKDFKDRQAKRARAKVLDMQGISFGACCCVVRDLAHARRWMTKTGLTQRTSNFPPPPPCLHQAKQNASAAANQQQAGGDASAHGQSTASLPVAAGNTKADHHSGGATGVAGGPAAGAGGASASDDGVDAGIDLSEEAYSAGADHSGARVLCAWLNANVATTFIEVRRR